MKKTSRHAEKALKLEWLTGLPKRVKRWDLLFIDAHGKVISFQNVRELLIIFVIVILLMMAAALYLYVIQKNTREKNTELSNTLAESREEVKKLRQEMHTLMLRLAEAQSKLPRNRAPDKPVTGKKAAAGEKKGKTPETRVAEVRVDKQKKTTSEQTGRVNQSAGGKTQPDTPSAALPQIVQEKNRENGTSAEEKKVAGVYDLSAFYDPDLNALNVRLLVKNPTVNADPVSGYVFVIMKEDKQDQKGWYPLPWVELVSGKPSRIDEGQFFMIRNFKNLEMQSGHISGPKTFNLATVLEFSPSGELLLEKTFSVKINVPGSPAQAADSSEVSSESEEGQPSDTVEQGPDTERDTGEIILRKPQDRTPPADTFPAKMP